MRWTQTLIPTLRQVPTEAVVPSHQLMLRAGYIQQVAAGAYNYLPLGWRTLHKAMAIIRDEMNRAGASEVFMPSLQPIEWWEKTGRRARLAENLFVVEDRHGREQALGPTHEEVITMLFGTSVASYKQLPINLYQIQTKFRDEYRPRFGVLRSREFQMKDAYSFHLTPDGPAGLDAEYRNMYDTYCRIFDRCGLKYVVVEAETGDMGGNASHQFTVLTPVGEDTIFTNDAGTYSANIEKCATGRRCFSIDGEPTGDLRVVDTPDCKSIDDLCARWPEFGGSKLKAKNTLKTLAYHVKFNFPPDLPETHTSRLSGHDSVIWLAVVRGDHDVNEEKIKEQIERRHKTGDWKSIGLEIQMLDEEIARQMGIPLGYVGPDLRWSFDDPKVRECIHLVVDYDAMNPGFWVTGANETGKHKMHFDWWRDFIKHCIKIHDDGPETDRGSVANLALEMGHFRVEDIRNAIDGDPAPEERGGGTLHATRGIEVGQVFKLGRKYTQALDVTVLDENQQAVTPIMGCYGIGVNRILAAAIEQDGGHDDGGIIWPVGLAPFHVVITPIKYTPASDVARVADALHDKLTAAGLDVLLDDRDERPGVKFKDADLIGIPLRITVGDKALANQEVEFKPRTADQAELVKVEDAVARAVAFVRGD